MTPLERNLMNSLHKAAASKFDDLNALRAFDPQSAALEFLQQEWEEAELRLAVFRDDLLEQRMAQGL